MSVQRLGCTGFQPGWLTEPAQDILDDPAFLRRERGLRRNRIAQLPKLRDKVMREIEAAEARRSEIAAIYADPGFFQRAGRDEIDALVRENDALGPKLDALMGEWEAIEREIEAG